jgi:hypothetical protein
MKRTKLVYMVGKNEKELLAMEEGTFKQCLTGLSYETKRYYHHI